MFDCRSLEAEQNRDHHHAEPERQGTPDHGCAAADSVDEEGWEEAAEDEHDLDTAADDEGEVVGETDVVGEDGWDEVAVRC